MKEDTTHHGNLLEWWVKTWWAKKRPISELLKKLAFKDYTSFYYYYKKQDFKRATVQKFAAALGISTEQFFKSRNAFNVEQDEPIMEDPETAYGISKHHGRNLETTLHTRGINISAFASKLKISRPTLYKHFNEKDLPLGVLLECAHHLQVPVAMLKGTGVGERSFEKDIYLELQTIHKQLQLLTERFAGSVP